MELGLILGFAAIAFTLIAVPGPDWAYILAAGARDRVVLPAVGGLMLGYTLITAVIAVGVGPVAANVPFILVALTIVGAGYLVYLGVKTLRSTARIESDGAQKTLARGPFGYVARGVAVSGLNPKGLLLFLSILPQFARANQPWPLPVQLAVLGMVFVLICGVFYLVLGFAANRVLGSRPRVAQITTRVAGIAMILVGLALLGERAVEIIHAGGVVV